MASRLVQTVGPGRPRDLHFETCMNSTEVMSLLQPKPIAVRPREDEPPAKRPRNEKAGYEKGQQDRPSKGRGKCKGKNQQNQFMRIPSELLNLGCAGATSQGNRLCFSFNLKKCSNNVQNQRCALFISEIAVMLAVFQCRNDSMHKCRCQMQIDKSMLCSVIIRDRTPL